MYSERLLCQKAHKVLVTPAPEKSVTPQAPIYSYTYPHNMHIHINNRIYL